MFTDFVDYVDSFYGQNDPLYPLEKNGVYEYLQLCTDESETLYTWGDGDSLDRERVRDILLNQFNYTHKEDK